MSRSRRHPPLFEVLERSNRGLPARGRAPGVIVAGSHVPPPAPEIEAEAAPEREVDPQGEEQDWSWDGGRVYRVPSNVLFVGIAVVIGLLILVWNLAYRVGQADETSKLAAGTVPDELAEVSPAGPGLDVIDPIGRIPSGLPLVNVDPEARPTAVGVAGAGGLEWNEDVDPRVPETNYLVIARMPWQDARAAAYFLADQGVPAAAVPAGSRVDLAGVKAKNGMCEVIALQGVSSDDYRASKEDRDRLEAEVLRVGRVWKREGGSDDFSSRYWRKHKG